MPVKIDQSRRIWKVRAAKAFVKLEALALWDLRKIIGQKALDDLFTESFLAHPDDPVAGAKMARANLHQRYGERLLQARSSAR